MTKSIHRELVLSQPPEQVWQAIASRAALAEWMFPNNFEPRVGHQFSFHVPPNPAINFDGLEVRCEVLVCDPPWRLVFSWAAAEITNTEVSFQLEPSGTGTRLLFEHAGFDVTPSWGEQAYRGAEYGWAKMLKQLTAVVTRLHVTPSTHEDVASHDTRD